MIGIGKVTTHNDWGSKMDMGQKRIYPPVGRKKETGVMMTMGEHKALRVRKPVTIPSHKNASLIFREA